MNTIPCHTCRNNNTNVEPMSTAAKEKYMRTPRTIFCGHWVRHIYASRDMECTAYDRRRHTDDAKCNG